MNWAETYPTYSERISELPETLLWRPSSTSQELIVAASSKGLCIYAIVVEKVNTKILQGKAIAHLNFASLTWHTCGGGQGVLRLQDRMLLMTVIWNFSHDQSFDEEDAETRIWTSELPRSFKVSEVWCTLILKAIVRSACRSPPR